MKKVYCNNLSGKGAACVQFLPYDNNRSVCLSKRPEEKITQKVRNHECTHARQWVEMAVADRYSYLGSCCLCF